MSNEGQKDGFSVQELENFAKNNRFKLFVCLSLLLACFFSFVFFSFWNVIFIAAGGILGTLFPSKIESLFHKITEFCTKQENATQIVLGSVSLIVAIFLPPLTLLALGLAGGKYLESLKPSKN